MVRSFERLMNGELSMHTMRDKKLVGYTIAVHVKRKADMYSTLDDVEDTSILEPGVVFVEPQLTEDETRHMAWEVARRNAMMKYPPPMYFQPRVVVSMEPTHHKLGNTVEYVIHFYRQEDIN